MAKVDVRSAYRNIPVHPDDRWLMGIMWEGALYVDTALPFGLRSAPKIFTAVADAAQSIIQQEGVDFIIHYLDDFLVIGTPESEECAVALATVLRVFERLGFPCGSQQAGGSMDQPYLPQLRTRLYCDDNSSPSPEAARATGSGTCLERSQGLH